MYQIFVVEDELLIRQSIRRMVENMGEPYVCCGEASDGEMALSMMQELMPDIVLSDIRMPFLDGFELISHLKKVMPWVRVIIISGYGDFEYAQKAIRLGVDQYLLKPVRQQELVKAITELGESIERDRRAHGTVEGFDLDDVHAALYQRFMKELLHGGLTTSQALEQAGLLNLELIYPWYQAVIFSFDSEGYDHRVLRDQGMRIVREQNLPFYWFNGSDRLTILLAGQEEQEVTEQAYRIITIFRHDLQQICPVITTVLSNTVRRVSNIPDAYMTAKDLVKKLSSVSAGHVVDANDTVQITAQQLEFTGLPDEAFRHKLQTCSPEEVDALVQDYVSGSNGSQFDSMLIRYSTLVNVLKLSAQMMASAVPGTDVKDVSSELSSRYNLLTLAGRRDTFVEAMTDMLRAAVAGCRDAQPNTKHRHMISQAMEFISMNFCDPNISLQAVADQVNVSAAHFSTVFSQATGTTFINYLTELRIQRAKELLSGTDRKLAVIAMDIGYNEPNYFSHVFRKMTGMTPKEYRNSTAK